MEIKTGEHSNEEEAEREKDGYFSPNGFHFETSQ